MEEELEVLKYCLQFSKRAYEQEIMRQKSAMNKAEYLFKYLTLLATVFNIVVSIILKESYVNTDKHGFLTIYFMMLLVGVIGIISSLMIEIPRKKKMFGLGLKELREVKKNPDDYCTEFKRTYQEILWVDTITERMRENSDKALKWILVSYVALAFMIVLFGVLITYVVFAA